jgi:hypothetical protein
MKVAVFIDGSTDSLKGFLGSLHQLIIISIQVSERVCAVPKRITAIKEEA